MKHLEDFSEILTTEDLPVKNVIPFNQNFGSFAKNASRVRIF
jgi:hypothetical protein